MYNVAFDNRFGKCPFEKISQTVLDVPSFPFAGVLPKEIIESTFRKYDGLFDRTFYNTIFVLWAFLRQTLSDGKSRSCFTTVGRNRVRKVMCETAHFGGVFPRRLSFTRTCALLLDLRLWQLPGLDLERLLGYLGSLVVPHWPGRFETPRLETPPTSLSYDENSTTKTQINRIP